MPAGRPTRSRHPEEQRSLIGDLGLEPGAELRSLEQAILRQDAVAAPRLRSPLQPVRKTATILVADVGAAGSRAEELDPEALRTLLDRCASQMSAVVEGHGGTIERVGGDAATAVSAFRLRMKTTRCAPFVPRSRCEAS